MNRKRLTQMFPWLLPLRRFQKTTCTYLRMRFSRCRYASHKSDVLLPYTLFGDSSPLYNHETGFDMCYQENKVFNLKLAADTLHTILIRPGESFSFWWLVRKADKKIAYKDGLVVINGQLTTAPGGGLCQMSNLLFWLFLHTPLSISERHSHGIKDFPDPKEDALLGVDATVSEGWLDLQLSNNTEQTFQISLSFDESHILGSILTDKEPEISYQLANDKLAYYRRGEKVYEEVDVWRLAIDNNSKEELSKELLYRNSCEIGYALPENIKIREDRQVWED